MLRVLDIVEGTTVDGPGLRTSIYFAGCTHHCHNCHNPQSWNPEGGSEHSIDSLMDVIRKNRFNVTLSGGDPFYQAEGVTELCKRIHDELGYGIWCYTGYLWEEIVRSPRFLELARNVDVIVDGRFDENLKDESLIFRGSSNQRIIDVPKSLRIGEMIMKIV